LSAPTFFFFFLFFGGKKLKGHFGKKKIGTPQERTSTTKGTLGFAISKSAILKCTILKCDF
jgi:hypothetical protein